MQEDNIENEIDKLLEEVEDLSVTDDKILVIIDLNGLVLSRYYKHSNDRPDDIVNALVPHSETVGSFYVWKRPHAEEFIGWLLDNYRVAVWSSATGPNVGLLVKHLFGKRERELLFQYDQKKCLPRGTHKDGDRPIYTKPLAAVWKEYKAYGPENTVLIDDSPEKTMDNPEHTVLVTKTWTIFDHGEPRADEGLSKSGAVREDLTALCTFKRELMAIPVKEEHTNKIK